MIKNIKLYHVTGMFVMQNNRQSSLPISSGLNGLLLTKVVFENKQKGVIKIFK